MRTLTSAFTKPRDAEGANLKTCAPSSGSPLVQGPDIHRMRRNSEDAPKKREPLAVVLRIARCCCLLSGFLTACGRDYEPVGLEQRRAETVAACQEQSPIFGPEVWSSWVAIKL